MLDMQKHEAAYFCHGMPGSEHDAQLLGQIDDRVCLIAPNLLHLCSADLTAGVLKGFDTATRDFADGTVNAVGFSIGAMVAIKIAAARPNRVGRLTLISPAAPLSLGNFLPDLAGQQVFKLAKKHPPALKLLTAGQGALSYFAPDFLIKQLFAKCGEAERKLIDDPAFRDILKQGFANSFRRHPDAYMGFVRSYVEDWSADLNSVTCPVELWHGVQDTWSPITMSQALCKGIAGPSTLHSVQGTEHYSTLSRVCLTPLNPEG